MSQIFFDKYTHLQMYTDKHIYTLFMSKIYTHYIYNSEDQFGQEIGTEPDFRLRGGKKYAKKILDL